MEICDPTVMFPDKFPNLHRVLMITVKRAVHEFDLRHFLFDKKGKFPFYQFNIPEAQFLFNR